MSKNHTDFAWQLNSNKRVFVFQINNCSYTYLCIFNACFNDPVLLFHNFSTPSLSSPDALQPNEQGWVQMFIMNIRLEMVPKGPWAPSVE